MGQQPLKVMYYVCLKYDIGKANGGKLRLWKTLLDYNVLLDLLPRIVPSFVRSLLERTQTLSSRMLHGKGHKLKLSNLLKQKFSCYPCTLVAHPTRSSQVPSSQEDIYHTWPLQRLVDNRIFGCRGHKSHELSQVYCTHKLRDNQHSVLQMPDFFRRRSSQREMTRTILLCEAREWSRQ